MVEPAQRVSGSLSMPGDKSIGHRALIFNALAEGRAEVLGAPDSQDLNSTLRCLRALGVEIAGELSGGRVVINGVGVQGLRSAAEGLDAGNSGTTARLLMGVLAGQQFDTRLSGDWSLSQRPMLRVSKPLEGMGARFSYLQQPGCLPVVIHGGRLKYGELDMQVPSAQVKSAVLLAGIVSGWGCTVIDRAMTRNHTELMLKEMGAPIQASNAVVCIGEDSKLSPLNMTVPGDISSAMFFAGAAALLPGSELTVSAVGVNPGRTGMLEALRRMGAVVELSNEQTQGGEPLADITVRSGGLKGISLGRDETTAMIDELPLLAVLATQAEGRTEVRGAEELRVKESDRIATIAAGIRAMGGRIEELPDGFVIEGPQKLQGGVVDSHGDHRIAMALAIGALAAAGPTTITGAGAVSVSFPGFWEKLSSVVQHG
ncbi:3-phosphoshikimate 1-carboxyvinyltransferase [bacterium]|nr:3-phosphoshikimate 1-carboxyvinyltransferase [bacterium]